MDRDYLLKSTFKLYDLDKSNSLNNTEFTNLLKKFSKHITVTDKDIYEPIFVFLDTERKGELTFDQIVYWWHGEQEALKIRLLTGERSRLLIKAYTIFKLFSEDNQLSFVQFNLMGKYLDLASTRGDFILADTNMDGYLNFKEFVDWLGWL